MQCDLSTLADLTHGLAKYQDVVWFGMRVSVQSKMTARHKLD